MPQNVSSGAKAHSERWLCVGAKAPTPKGGFLATRLGCEILEKNDVRGMPEDVRDGATRLAGHDDFKKIRISGQVGKLYAPRVIGKRCCESQMAEEGKDDFIGGSKRYIDADAPELQKGVALVEVPGQPSAERDGTVEAFHSL